MTNPLILVCDDVRNIVAIVVQHLQAEGYRTAAAGSALEAVSLARKEPPALIIMDIMMPGLDGATASELMHETAELAAVPVVLFSAMPEQEIRERAEQCGARGWLSKPFSKQSLLDAVRKLLPPVAA